MIIYGRYYLARSNERVETRSCPHCRRVAAIESFDAFEWGHVYFVPLIPLGRRHVFDKCRTCDMLRDMPLAEWAEKKKAALATIGLHFDRDKDNAEFACEALELYTLFGTMAQAIAVASHIESRHANDSVTRARLAQWFAAQGQLDRAVRLAGETPAEADKDDVHRTIAGAAIVTGDSLRAKSHLLQITAPQVGADFLPLLNLALTLRKANRPREAYEVFGYLFQHFPKQATNHTLAVQGTAALERDLGIRKTILPPNANPHRDTIIGVGVVATVILGVLVANLVIAQIQDLYLFNPTVSAAQIRIDEREVQLTPGASTRLRVAEGEHLLRVQLDNGHVYETRVEVQNQILQRFSMKNAFVFNVLGAETFAWKEVVYVRDGNDEAADEGRQAFVGGRDFHAFHGIHYPFVTPPARIKLDGPREIRTLLYRVDASPAKIVAATLDGGEAFAGIDARRLAEGQLVGGSRDADLVRAYLGWCTQHECHDDALAFLAELGIGPPDR